MAEILVIDPAVLATFAVFWRVKRPAGMLLLPYSLWLAFATMLNYAIWTQRRIGTRASGRRRPSTNFKGR